MKQILLDIETKTQGNKMNTQVDTLDKSEEQQKSEQRHAELGAKLKNVLAELSPLRIKSWDSEDDFVNDLINDDPEVSKPAQFENSFKIECPSNVESSASLGYAPGQYASARFYEEGVASNDFFWGDFRKKEDLLSAIYWYAKAEKQDFPLAKGRSGQLFERLRKNAEAGDPDAAYDVAMCYETGFMGLVDHDPKVAIAWYEKAAQAGHPIANLSLGENYYFGQLSAEPDKETALRFYDQYIQWFFSPKSFEMPLVMLRGMDFIFAGLGAETLPVKALFNLAAQLYEAEDVNRLERIVEGFVNSRIYGEIDEDGEVGVDNTTGWQNRLLISVHHYSKSKNQDKFCKDLRDLLFYVDDAEVTAVGELDDPKEDPDFNLKLRAGIIGFGDAFHDVHTERAVSLPFSRCRRMEATLRKAADDGVDEAGLLLGLILVHSSPADSPDASEGKGWLEKGVRKNDILSCLWYASLGLRGLIQCGKEEIKIALKRVIYADFDDASHLKKRSELKPRQYKGEIFTPEDCQTLRQRAADQLADIEREEATQLTKEQTQRDMLSYLTHTLNNTLSSGPEAARQAMRILGSELYENNREYKAINNIASMFSTFLFVQQLLKTFKLYIADPDMLRQNWGSDMEGDASITVVLALALRQTLSQLVFSANHQAALQRLLPHKEAGAIKATRKSFMEEIVPLDVDAENTAVLFDWVESHLGAVTLSIDPAAELHFRSNSTRFTFFFSSFSELIYNALKYSDGTRPIEMAWEKAYDHFVFRCRNTWTEESLQSSEGSGKGLLFLTRLVDMLGASLTTQREDGVFVAEIRFPEKLIKGE